MKKRVFSVFLIVAMLILAVIPAENVLAASKPKLSKAKATMEVDSKLTLKLNNAGDAKVTWSSSNKKVATVTSKGVVTAKSEGDATITAKCDSKKYTCKVTVIDSSEIPDTLTAGVWIVGEDIPEGKYTFNATNGVGTIEIYGTYESYEDNEYDWIVYETLAVITENSSDIFKEIYSSFPSSYRAVLKDGQCVVISGLTLEVDYN